MAVVKMTRPQINQKQITLSIIIGPKFQTYLNVGTIPEASVVVSTSVSATLKVFIS